MKFPLTLKVVLMLAANVVLLAGLGTGWFLLRGEAGWQTLATGPLGDRAQVIADTLMRELWDTPVGGRADVLAGYKADYGAEFLWVRNDGHVLAGESHALPPPVLHELNRGPLQPRPSGLLPPPGNAPPPSGSGRFLFHAPSGDYWFGLRWHPAREEVNSNAPPPRTTLLIRVDSAWRLARLLGLHWWAAVPGAAMVISVLFWWPFAQAVSRRLRRLTKATEHLAEGRFSTRAGVSGSDELGRLGLAVDRMAARLDTLINGQKRFLGDVAHELGSPLGRLQVALEILQQKAAPEQHAMIEDLREEIQAMTSLVNELLDFTRADLRPRAATLASVDLGPLCAQVLARENATDRVVCLVPDGAKARADGQLLMRALSNLVRNALRHAGDGTAIRLEVRPEGKTMILTLDDDGPGVPPEALARLGEPFYRPEAARTRETGGAGLGLAIVRGAVTACGGDVHFANRAPHGFSARICLASA